MPVVLTSDNQPFSELRGRMDGLSAAVPWIGVDCSMVVVLARNAAQGYARGKVGNEEDWVEFIAERDG